MTDVFVGRQDELRAIGEAAAQARAGHPVVVVLEGDAGTGKSALARHALARLGTGTNVVSAVADELEMDRPLALLRAWVEPAMASSPFEAGLAVLERLSELNEGPLLVVRIEDLHWADPVSRAALLAAARRLDSERLLMLITTRPGGDRVDAGWERFLNDPERARRIPVRALTVDDVADLARRQGRSLQVRSARRLHSHTDGNALYITTLLRECTAEQLNAVELPVPSSLAATVAEGVAGLPDDARELLAALAVLNAPTPLPRLGAVAGVGAPADELEAIVATGYVTWHPHELIGPLTFSHPLYQAAVYSALPAHRRRDLHLASAAVTDHSSALAHRVAAADRFDDALADELETAAGTAATPQHAAELLRWSTELSSQRSTGERRLLRAGQLLLKVGDFDALAALRPQLSACTPGPLRSIIIGQLAWRDGDAVAAERHLVAATQAADPDLACLALVLLTHQYNIQNRPQDAVQPAMRAVELGIRGAVLERAACSARAVAVAMLAGPTAGLDVLAERLPAAPPDVAPADVGLLVVRGVLHSVRRPRAAVADLSEVTRRLRADLNPEWLPRAHIYLGQSLATTGAWDEALMNAHLALDLLVDDDQRWERGLAHQAAAYVYAARGQWEHAQHHVDGAAAAASVSGTIEGRFASVLAAVAVHGARREPEAVLAAIQPLLDEPSLIPSLVPLSWWMTYLGALVESHRIEEADHHIGQLDEAARVRHVEVMSQMAALRAELAATRGEIDDALDLYADAVAAISPDDPLLDIATIHFNCGRLLRRTGERPRALEHLRHARALLEPVLAEPYIARIDAELSDAGLPRPGRHRGSPLDLTSREHDVALLAGRGLTNKEIAAQLYVSAKAVDYHLGKIYGKLGINSRRQLRDRTPEMS